MCLYLLVRLPFLCNDNPDQIKKSTTITTNLHKPVFLVQWICTFALGNICICIHIVFLSLHHLSVSAVQGTDKN